MDLFKDPDIENIRKMEINILELSLRGIQKEMTDEQFTDALIFVNETLEIPLSPRSLAITLACNGYAYANIIEFGIDDTVTKEAICDAISLSFLKCKWPNNGDEIDMDDFYSRLIKVIKKGR